MHSSLEGYYDWRGSAFAKSESGKRTDRKVLVMNSNKRFRRSAVALAAGASLVFGVAACSDDAEDAKDKAGDAANKLIGGAKD